MFRCAIDQALAKKSKNKNKNKKSKVGLKEVAPEPPQINDRLGMSPIIRFSLHTSPGASEKEVTKSKSQSGVGLKEVWHGKPKSDRMGRSPPD